MNKVKTNRKGGAEKIRDKRIAELKAAGSHPKQKKLQFCSTINTRSDNFNDDTSEFEIKTNNPIFSSDPVCTSTSTVHNSNNLNINEKSLELVIESDETKNPTFSSENYGYTIQVDLKFPTNPKNLTVVQKLEFVNTIHPCQPKFFRKSLERIHVLEQVFEIVKLLGKQNLPYRGSGSSESLYNINCENINYNRGNFLELLKFTAKRDSILNDYLTVAIESSKKRKENISNNSKGRGSLVTMLSKNTVNRVILAILELIIRKIKDELGYKQFSIQVDSTQDMGSTDQAAVCIRYVFKSEVKERLFAVLEVKNSSGKGMYELLKKCFDDHSINFKNIVGESFDGAANMRGDFNGLYAYIKKENENSIYIWCYAHILNLCICDTCDNKDAIKLFGLLNRLSTFFSDSYKRMNVWKEQQEQLGTGQNKLRKLQKIGETQWWSRENALKWVFSGADYLYPVVLSSLNFVTTSSKFDPKSSSEASSLIENLCNFKTICTAHVFLKIFFTVGSTSTYLQTKNLDLLAAWEMVNTTIKEIDKINFDDVMSESEKFCSDMNTKLTTVKLPEDIIVESEFKQNRIRRTKRTFDEICSDEAPINPKQKFKVEVFLCIIDQLKTSLSERFINNTSLIVDMQYLLPKHFKDLKSDDLPGSALQKLSTLASVDHPLLIAELKHFASIYNSVKQPLNKSNRIIYDSSDDNSHEKDDGINDNLYELPTDIRTGCDKSMRENDNGHNRDSCLLCVHKLINSLNMHSPLYSNLFTAIEFVLTLSVSQVNCERVFSKLKIIKNRLRSSLGNEHLEAFLLMTVEKEILDEIEFEDILEIVKSSSPLMSTLLSKY
ncbi:zinc finger MYM-type protein 1-like [Hydra vulgaris]|uniref:Zinc finger MYM-type protein 1-like n=1 Tax=Hydra vulgaris TaxID=6087 RepID=A0ABM4CB38_HYDVU